MKGQSRTTLTLHIFYNYICLLSSDFVLLCLGRTKAIVAVHCSNYNWLETIHNKQHATLYQALTHFCTTRTIHCLVWQLQSRHIIILDLRMYWLHSLPVTAWTKLPWAVINALENMLTVSISLYSKLFYIFNSMHAPLILVTMFFSASENALYISWKWDIKLI